jgi:hypothetical protein
MMKYRWLYGCSKSIDYPIGLGPLCLSKYVYFIFMRPTEPMPIYFPGFYEQPVFEISLNTNRSIVGRVAGNERFCGATLTTEFDNKVHAQVSIRGFARDAMGLIFEYNSCPFKMYAWNEMEIKDFEVVQEHKQKRKMWSLVHKLLRPQHANTYLHPYSYITTSPDPDEKWRVSLFLL